MRPLFELLYRSHTLYWLASTIPFAGQWRVWQRLVIPRIRGHDVLEVGCGTGTLLTDMLGAGFTCQAVDRSHQMVAATRSRLIRAGFPARIVQQAEVQKLPFAGASFDTVVSTFPTEYIADPAALAEIARVLRPDGRLIVVLGATLMPKSVALLPFIALQRLVYGRAPRRAIASGDTRSDERRPLPAVAAPLHSAGLEPSAETVSGPFWIAYLCFGEKSSAPKHPAAR